MSYKEAIETQRRLAAKVWFRRITREPRIVAGLDCAFSKDEKKIFAAVVVIELKSFTVIETTTASRKITFPYIPGLLSFRETPVCIDAIEKLKSEPDIFIVDGQGYAHPRRFGIACHIGVLADKPTAGCAKSRLIGNFEVPGRRKGKYSNLLYGDDVVGAVLRTRADVKPVFVSVGNKITLDDAIRIVLKCTDKYRLPEPSRLAHQLVSKIKLQG